AGGPLDRRVAPDLLLPVGTDAATVIGEDVTGAAAVGTMYHDQVGRWQLHPRIQAGNSRVIPFRDLPQKNSHHRRAIEFEFRVAGQIVSDHDSAGDGWQVQNLSGRFGQVLVAHRTVGSPKIHRL